MSAWDNWPKAMIKDIQEVWARNAAATSNVDKVGSGSLARVLRGRYGVSVSNATLDRYAKATGRKSWGVP